MAYEDFFSRKLKDLDVFKRLPKEVSKGSLFGVLLSVVTIVLIGMLLLNEIILYLGFTVESGVVIDHSKDSGMVEVHLDIEFEKHPCHLLGLDYVDYIGSHTNDVKENLKYYIPIQTSTVFGNIPGTKPFDKTRFKNDEELIEDLDRALKEGEKCRLMGSFKVLMVPGNFHIGFHSTGHLIQKYMAKLGKRFEVDFTHRVHALFFGTNEEYSKYYTYQKDFKLKHVAQLMGQHSSAMIDQPGDFSYKYKLMVVPTMLEYENGRKEETIQYRVFWNVAYFEPNFNYLISFDYDLSSVTMTEKRVKKTFNEFLIHICGIVGGCVAFANFIHMLLQKSVLKLLHKQALGKYD